MMKFFSGILRSRKTLTSVERTLYASSELPTCNFLSLENSTGASKNGAEFSKYLDDTLTTLDFSEPLSAEKVRLEGKVRFQASKYENSRLPDGVGIEWTGSKADAAMLYVAAKCAKEVYNDSQMGEGGVEGFKFSVVKTVEATTDGTTKRTVFTEVQAADFDDKFPVLVIAVRGSSSVVDWVVNANGDASDAADFLSLPTEDRIRCHSGFLSAAKTLEPKIRKEIGNFQNVVFTGHSAGGAVASLLFAKFLPKAGRDCNQDIRYSLITFGAPPVTNPCITPLLRDLEAEAGLNLAVVNEGDPVTRVDPLYVMSLIDLYRVSIGLYPERDENVWKLPEPCMFAIGDILVLRDMNYEKDGVDLRAAVVGGDDFGKLLYANAAVHTRDMYLENTEMVFRG